MNAARFRQLVTKRRALRYGVLAFLVLWPWYGTPYVVLGDANTALIYAIVAASLVLLTGWVGQISLAQASFVGIGAFTAALVATHAHLGFPISLIAGGVVAGAAATLLGAVALRVRGLYLAVTTLIFAWICDSYVFLLPQVGGGAAYSVPGRSAGTEGAFPYFDFTNRRTFYYVGLAVAALVLFALANLRDSKTGRALAAIKGSEIAAASLAINVTRYKLLAFALSGFVAGMAGSLLAVYQGVLSASQFRFTVSFFYLAIPVVGGLRSLEGAVAASVVFGLLSDIFYRVPALNGYLELVSALMLVGVLLAYPGGLSAAGVGLRRLAAARRRRGEPPPAPPPTPETAAAESAPEPALPPKRRRRPLVVASVDITPREERRALVQAEGVTVRFGGLTAVDSVSLAVREGEIVGLIGPNGAGKTTLFNAIAGLNRPSEGSVHLFGQDATELSVSDRAALGVARTFQAIQLVPEMTVFDNLMVATHAANTTGFLSHIAVTTSALLHEHRCRERVTGVLEELALDDVAERLVSGLPFGTLRMVEVARALVTGSPLIMLDEPASGLDNRETAVLADLLLRLRSERGITILLIEHDVQMVTSVCDYMYVLDRGALIASGATSDVREDPRVIAAYLGERPPSEPVPAGAQS